MTDESSTSTSEPAKATAAAAATPSKTTWEFPKTFELPESMKLPKFPKSWELPTGIEGDLEQALVKGAVGALAGGVVGLICFKGGKGARAASIATGFGAGIGSTWERVRHRYERSDEKAATN